jgi:hypothetical protein
MRRAARMSPTSPSSRLPAAEMPNKHRRKVSIADVTSANARTSAITGVGCAAQQQPHQRMLENPRAARQRVGCASHNANIDIAAATHVSAFRTHVWRQKPAAQWCTAKGLVAELKEYSSAQNLLEATPAHCRIWAPLKAHVLSATFKHRHRSDTCACRI